MPLSIQPPLLPRRRPPRRAHLPRKLRHHRLPVHESPRPGRDRRRPSACRRPYAVHLRSKRSSTSPRCRRPEHRALRRRSPRSLPRNAARAPAQRRSSSQSKTRSIAPRCPRSTHHPRVPKRPLPLRRSLLPPRSPLSAATESCSPIRRQPLPAARSRRRSASSRRSPRPASATSSNARFLSARDSAPRGGQRGDPLAGPLARELSYTCGHAARDRRR